MTNQEILEKAIQKAIDGGFYSFADGAFGKPEFVVLPKDKFGQIKVHVKDWPNEYQSAEAIIFNHEFAKALWGKAEIIINIEKHINLAEPYKPNRRFDITIPNWQYHLQQMVIADDPIKYLGENL